MRMEEEKDGRKGGGGRKVREERGKEGRKGREVRKGCHNVEEKKKNRFLLHQQKDEMGRKAPTPKNNDKEFLRN